MKTCDTCNAEKMSIPYVVYEATASVNNAVGTPAVTVTAGGTASARRRHAQNYGCRECAKI